ncbi:hypothetical protein DACRYDRAFT_104207 [Dacryopinax primogenitus]|uniref:S-adenosyl-L-methionine-dependent methyltransferase n=1 Tax=Dacryopinax primogenitus (strain DJM 731) TaxID=1858805 RepID=M5G642_DACPD|nr:uncharacterized protein DACRYDRAFT_104207 [Dacryopinax primogenitus]EJU05721.1 hypothetical protein DACRYDRAFT_104207 [Dacryopinax primogenitus]
MSTPHPHHFRPATTHADWTKTDQYHNKYLLSQDEALEFALKNTDANGIPLISVSAAQGKYLYLLAKTLGAKQILEVGTLGAYSTIWMAKALPEGGEIISLEVNPKHAKISTENIAHAAKARLRHHRKQGWLGVCHGTPKAGCPAVLHHFPLTTRHLSTHTCNLF